MKSYFSQRINTINKYIDMNFSADQTWDVYQLTKKGAVGAGGDTYKCIGRNAPGNKSDVQRRYFQMHMGETYIDYGNKVTKGTVIGGAAKGALKGAAAGVGVLAAHRLLTGKSSSLRGRGINAALYKGGKSLRASAGNSGKIMGALKNGAGSALKGIGSATKWVGKNPLKTAAAIGAGLGIAAGIKKIREKNASGMGKMKEKPITLSCIKVVPAGSPQPT